VADNADSFLSRWSRRKAEVRAGVVIPSEAEVAQVVEPVGPAVLQQAPAMPLADTATAPSPVGDVAESPAAPAPPTMADVALLTKDADYTRYLGGNVSPEVKNAALRHLFTDPHFNVMDGLDTYLGDYNTPDPLPAGMLRQMVQSKLLGLFDDEEETADENPDLQLQPDDDAGCPGPETGAGEDARRPD
jgi:hypothetical protein